MAQNDKLFKVLDEYIYFDDVLESQEYAKNNPGKVVTRNPNYNKSAMSFHKRNKRQKSEKTPKMILEYLNKHVISQDEAKKEIALAIYYHTLRSHYPSNSKITPNGPVMIIGPTGSGKTFIVQKACDFTGTLFLHVDTASMVPEGIKGYSVSSLIQDLIFMADGDMEKASRAVIFFDEIDKLFYKDDSDAQFATRVSSQLLRFLEGGTFKVYNPSLTSEKESIDFNAKNVQFILGGAFQSILDDKQERKPVVGFTKEPTNNNNYKITLEDLYKNDVPKELLGRMSAIVNLQPLSESDYYTILTKSESSPLKEFVDKIKFHGDNVNISDNTLREISKIAAENELGVRSIRQTLKKIFNDALFNVADTEYTTHTIAFKDK